MMRNDQISVEFLNHASIILKYKDFSLLCDPWLEGDIYEGGWGLQYENPEAYDRAATCTHLWISHPHADHLHLPTLKRIAQRNPNLRVLINISHSADIQDVVEAAGFKNVIPFHERKKMEMNSEVTLARYPSVSIDNMLLIHAGPWRVLNYNDCDLPQRAIRALMRKVGPIDIFLDNFNHAGKLLKISSDESTKRKFRQSFLDAVNIIGPKWVIPFASTHYYRYIGAFHQNNSMWTIEEIAKSDSRCVGLHVGDKVVFSVNEKPLLDRRFPPVSRRLLEPKQYDQTISWQELVSAAKKHRDFLRHHFFGITFWAPPLHILVEEQNKILIFDLSKGIHDAPEQEKLVHMVAHSKSLYYWFTKPFGVDALCIGANFREASEDIRPIYRITFAGQLITNGVSLRQLAQMLMNPKKWSFFFNRREYILNLFQGGGRYLYEQITRKS